jgi:hypothetical protein
MIDGIIGYNCESKEKMVEKVYNRRRTLRDGQRSRSTSGEDSSDYTTSTIIVIKPCKVHHHKRYQ